jgi:hypothetical protein
MTMSMWFIVEPALMLSDFENSAVLLMSEPRLFMECSKCFFH